MSAGVYLLLQYSAHYGPHCILYLASMNAVVNNLQSVETLHGV